MPNIVAIQSESCDPFVRAAEKGEKVPAAVDLKPTLAEGIAIGRPARGEEILEYIYRHDVRLIRAPEDRILEARSLLAEKGIYCEHTTAANYAAYLKYCEVHGKRPTACLRCGGGTQIRSLRTTEGPPAECFRRPHRRTEYK